jgi:hypothetical protein
MSRTPDEHCVTVPVGCKVGGFRRKGHLHLRNRTRVFCRRYCCHKPLCRCGRRMSTPGAIEISLNIFTSPIHVLPLLPQLALLLVDFLVLHLACWAAIAYRSCKLTVAVQSFVASSAALCCRARATLGAIVDGGQPHGHGHQ